MTIPWKTLRNLSRQIFYYFLVSTFCSCTVYRVHKGENYIKRIDSKGTDKEELKIYKLSKRTTFKSIKETDSKNLILTLDGDLDETPEQTKEYSPGVIDQFQKDQVDTDNFFLEKSTYKDSVFHYWKEAINFQVINITFKNRFRTVNDLEQAVQDSFPSTWSSGFNPAIAVGFAETKVKYGKNGKKTLGFTIGGFFGLGVEKLSKDNTRNDPIEFARSALTVTPGFHANFGYQKWDFGTAIGWEFATGSGAKRWVYHGAPFLGVIFGYDIVKVRKE